MGGKADLGEVLYCFGLHDGVGEGRSKGKEAVVREEDGVVVGQKRLKARGYLPRAGGGVRGEGEQAGGHEDFGAEGLIEGEITSREGGGDGRVGMDEGI